MSASSSRFYGGMRQDTQVQGSAGTEELKKLLEEQKVVSKNLLKQNTSLLVLSAKMTHEIKELRNETSVLQDSTNDMKLQMSLLEGRK